MQMKKLIISADDLGASEENNKAIFSGVKDGVITATGLIVNMPGFEHAVKEILPVINVDIGLHFNMFEGKALTACPLLTDENGYFNKSFVQILISQNNKEMLEQIEAELKAQIEKILQYNKISHLDSHCHYHAIPAVFDIFIKLAKEYDIKYIRTQQEPFYVVLKKVFDIKFPKNIIKHVLLNTLTKHNKSKLEKEGLKTNDSFIGVLFTGYMDESAILSGMKNIKDGITEVIFHPYLPENLSKTERLNNYKEFLITKNPRFIAELKNSGTELIDFIKATEGCE